MDIFSRAKKFNLPLGQYALFGSSLLDVWGIRNANDLDIVVLPELYNQLKQKGWKEKRANGFTMLIKDDANVTTVQGKPTDGDYNPDRIKLIKDAILINEVPFVKIEEVLSCKKAYARPKDREDIRNIDNYIKNKNGKNLYEI